jgi:hypothetical protein
MRRFLRENSLSIFFLVIFLAALTGQAIAGHDLYNEETLSHGGDPISLWRYVTSSSFGQAVMENWQSEYLPSPARLAAIEAGRHSPRRHECRTVEAENDPRHAGGIARSPMRTRTSGPSIRVAPSSTYSNPVPRPRRRNPSPEQSCGAARDLGRV